MHIVERVNGISDCQCDGKWHLMYKDGADVLSFAGLHTGRMTGKDCTIEVFDTESEMNGRIAALGLTNPADEDRAL